MRSRRPCCKSTPEPKPLRVVQGLQADDRSASLAEDVDLERLSLARERGWHVARGEALADAVPECRRSHIADRRAVLEDRFVADRLRVGAGQLENHEAALRTGGALGEGGGAPGEVRFVECDVAIEAGLSRGVVRPKILVE